MKKIDRVGERNISNEGYEMIIIECNDSKNIIIEFQDKHKTKVHTAYKEFKNGSIKNPYHPNRYGGYLGSGKYKSRENKKMTLAYQTWIDMLKRCFDFNFHEKENTYKNCSICDEWLNFQNFAEWYYKHYYECNGERMHIDKDILNKGNKIYSPLTCILVPQRINELFIKCDKARGKYPIGVGKSSSHKGRYVYLIAYCRTLETREILGTFPLNRPFQAFTAYKEFKENYIKKVADEYKDLIPKELYDAMYRYEVEIND